MLHEVLLRTLPEDGTAGALAGRVWRPDWTAPSRRSGRRCGRHLGRLSDHSRPLREPRSRGRASTGRGEPIGTLDAVLANTPADTRDLGKPWLLAPVDLQAIKAAGVTFAVSMLERVIEERARGHADAAAAIRAEVQRLVGDDLAS